MPQARSVSRHCLENFKDCQLDEIVLAAASFPSLHPDLAFVDQLQQAGEKRIGALQHLDKMLIMMSFLQLTLMRSCLIYIVKQCHVSNSGHWSIFSEQKYTQNTSPYNNKDIINIRSSHKRHLGTSFLPSNCREFPGLQSWLSTVMAFRHWVCCPRFMQRDFYGRASWCPCSTG